MLAELPRVPSVEGPYPTQQGLSNELNTQQGLSRVETESHTGLLFGLLCLGTLTLIAAAVVCEHRFDLFSRFRVKNYRKTPVIEQNGEYILSPTGNAFLLTS